MSDRGIKKWAPYKSLVEQGESISKMESALEVASRPILSPDQEEEINSILVNYNGQFLNIKYYHNKKIYAVKAHILKIDLDNRRLILDTDEKVSLSEIIGIENLD